MLVKTAHAPQILQVMYVTQEARAILALTSNVCVTLGTMETNVRTCTAPKLLTGISAVPMAVAMLLLAFARVLKGGRVQPVKLPRHALKTQAQVKPVAVTRTRVILQQVHAIALNSGLL